MKPLFGAALAAALLLLAVPDSGLAQGFEGVVKMRTTSVGQAALSEALYSNMDESDEGADEEWEEGAFAFPPKLVFALGMDRILAAGEGDFFGDEGVSVEELTYTIKGPRLRVDGMAGGQEGFATMDLDAGVFRMVSPGEGMYIEYTKADFETLQGMGGAAEAGPGDGAEPAPEVRALGETREHNGMACALYEVSAEGSITQACVAKDLSDLVGAFEELAERSKAMTMEEDEAVDPMEALAEHGFPVLSKELTEYGRYEITELLSVEKTSVSDDAFAVPAGLQKKTLADLMQQWMPEE